MRLRVVMVSGRTGAFVVFEKRWRVLLPSASTAGSEVNWCCYRRIVEVVCAQAVSVEPRLCRDTGTGPSLILIECVAEGTRTSICWSGVPLVQVEDTCAQAQRSIARRRA